MKGLMGLIGQAMRLTTDDGASEVVSVTLAPAGEGGDAERVRRVLPGQIVSHEDLLARARAGKGRTWTIETIEGE